MRILVLGDSYCPAAALAPAFSDLPGHEVTFADVVDDPSWLPASPSEQAIREYLGTPAQVEAAFDGHEVLVVQGAPVTAALLERQPQLRLICVARGGPVNVDVSAATARGIPVVTTPGKNATAVAELTIACMVMLARHIAECVRHVESGGEVFVDNYEGAHWFGHDLAGHTLGLVGFGAIGSRVARRALAFDMRVLVSDPFVAADQVRDAGCEPATLDGLLAASDFVSLHARATAENRGMMGAAQFAAMRRGSWFINTARDTLIDRGGARSRAGQRPPRRGRPRRREPVAGGDAPPAAGPSQRGAAAPHRRCHHRDACQRRHDGGRGDPTRFAAGEPMRNVANRADLAVLSAS